MHLVHIVNCAHAWNNKRLNAEAFSAFQIPLGYNSPPALEARLSSFVKSEHFKIFLCMKKMALTCIRQ